MQTPLAGLRPTGVPALRVTAGRASPLPSLSLTGITGVDRAAARGRARTAGAAWSSICAAATAARRSRCGRRRGAPTSTRGRASSRCAPSSSRWDASRDVLPPSVLTPENTTLDAALDLAWAGDAVRFGGELAVVGLSLHHDVAGRRPDRERLARADAARAPPIRSRGGWSWSASRRGSATSRRALAGQPRAAAGHVQVRERQASWTWSPKIELAFTVPRVPCAKLLTSIPTALMPRLQGFVMTGHLRAPTSARRSTSPTSTRWS